MTSAKTVAGLRHLLRTSDFDYLLRTNTSTYVNLPMLRRRIEHLPSTGYYGGTTWEHEGLIYATGTSILMSRDLVEYAATDLAWDYDLVDDVALGRSMRRAGATVDPLPRVDLLYGADLEDLSVDKLESTYIFRCRGLDNREHDIVAMHRLDQFLRIKPYQTGVIDTT